MKKFKFTIAVLLLNTLYYIAYRNGVIGYRGLVILRGEVLNYSRFFTYTFTHIKWFHFYTNQIFIILLVAPFEYKFKTIKTMIIYYFGAVIGVVAYYALLTKPLGMTHGASGGWYAILGAWFINLDKVPWITRIAIVVIVVSCFIDTFTATNVNVIAHVGAFIIGVLYGRLGKQEVSYESIISKRQGHSPNRSSRSPI